MEKARGLAEVYRLAGFSPAKVTVVLVALAGMGFRPERARELSTEEKGIQKTADIVGLSYDYQYRLLTLLGFTPDEQRRVSELQLGYEEASR